MTADRHFLGVADGCTRGDSNAKPMDLPIAPSIRNLAGRVSVSRLGSPRGSYHESPSSVGQRA
jgi:hypothetical protein